MQALSSNSAIFKVRMLTNPATTRPKYVSRCFTAKACTCSYVPPMPKVAAQRTTSYPVSQPREQGKPRQGRDIAKEQARHPRTHIAPHTHHYPPSPHTRTRTHTPPQLNIILSPTHHPLATIPSTKQHLFKADQQKKEPGQGQVN